MAYQAIYRKWRPLTFEDVVGQPHITETIKTELVTGKVAHAYLFCGTRGTGKTTVAKILSRAVNCETPLANGNPCNTCSSCKGILNGTITDVIEIDAASNNGVDNIRELRDDIVYTPSTVKYKVYIVDEVHMLSGGAFNALLKTLEEPPAHAIFILATTEPHKIPQTVRSRCQRFDFRRISSRLIAGRIGEIARKDGIKISQDAIALVARLGDGSMRDALGILDLCSGISGEISVADIENVAGVVNCDVVRGVASCLINSDASGAIRYANTAISAGRDVGSLSEELLGFLRELLICRISPSSAEILDKSEEDLADIKGLCEKTDEEMLIHAIKALSDAISAGRWATNPRLVLETAFIKICMPHIDPSTEAFAARLKRLESAIFTGAAIPSDVAFQSTEIPKQSTAKPLSAADKSDKDKTNLSEETAKPGEPAKSGSEKGEIPKASSSASNNKPQTEPAAEELPLDGGEENTDWESIKAEIAGQDPAGAALLSDSKSMIRGDSFYIIFNSDALRDCAKQNQLLVKLIKASAKGLTLRFVTQDELSSKKQPKSDPLDEILARKNELGDQLTVF
ncbi:MAG: DNA polymerase III subunit tau [Firmicutes bacterium ADurb.Bin193]|nr:MAG: DNA polymerase III subunit tau [Firmicutes bacterium ADurb.Bin193]